MELKINISKKNDILWVTIDVYRWQSKHPLRRLFRGSFAMCREYVQNIDSDPCLRNETATGFIKVAFNDILRKKVPERRLAEGTPRTQYAMQLNTKTRWSSYGYKNNNSTVT